MLYEITYKLLVFSLFIFVGSMFIDEIFGQSEPMISNQTNDIVLEDITASTSDDGFSISVEFITMISVSVNAVLVFLIYKTFRQNKSEFSLLNRPWLNIRIGKSTNPPEGYCEVIVKNHGHLPANNVNIVYKDLSKKEPKEKELYSPIHSLMPSQEQSFFLSIIDARGRSIPNSNKMTFEYSYHAEIIIVFSYNKNNKKIIFEISEDTNFADDGAFIKTTYMD